MSGPEHEWRNSLAGTWNAHGKFWMEPGQPPIESPGTMVQTWTLDGRYMTTEFVGEFMGKWYYGRGVSGFNNATQKHESVWYDSFNTALRMHVGTREGDVLTLLGSFEMPGMGTIGTREVTTKIDEDHFTVEAWHIMGDQDFQVMEIQFERADSQPEASSSGIGYSPSAGALRTRGGRHEDRIPLSVRRLHRGLRLARSGRVHGRRRWRSARRSAGGVGRTR
ncbi:MAG: DUF1579 family protein [Planctomycetota bacterium]|jgi:hypothetical protein